MCFPAWTLQVGKDVSLNKEQGLWSVKSTDGKVVRGRMLVCADGSTSRLATQLGYCTAPPQVGSRPRLGCLVQGVSSRRLHRRQLPQCQALTPAFCRTWFPCVQGVSSRRLHRRQLPQCQALTPAFCRTWFPCVQGVSSRAYIAGGSHNADFDGLVFYPKWSLPG